MSVKMNSQCFLCQLRKNVETAQKLGDEETATAFTREMMKLFLSAPENASLTWFGPGTTALFQKIYGLPADRFQEEKALSNRFVLERMDAIRSRVEGAADPLYAGLQYAILGNYIDFSALYGKVSFEKLDEMLETAHTLQPDAETFRRFLGELETGKKLLYLTDNAGEIGFDRIFAEQLQRAYPHLQITFCVRGGPVVNDATREDAAAVGLPFRVMDNGGGFAGMDPRMISPEALAALESADVIFSKGQANVESLLGSGYNIYYAFLVKCVRFMELFEKPLFTPMLIRERRKEM